MRRTNTLRPLIAAALCLSLLCTASLSGCSKPISAQEQDILSQKITEAGRTPITVLVKYAFSINAFEQAVEEKFPDIDLIQVGNYTRDIGVEEYAARLEHDDLTDIVMTWPLDVGEAYWEDRLLDLSGMDFTNNYNISVLNDISRDGKLYYLPGPSQVRGIVYNKTLFEENGWQIPKTFDEFVSLCRTIERSGIRAIQLGFKNEEVLDTAFIGYGYGDCFSKPLDSAWIRDYNEGSGSFGDHFGPALNTFQTMINAGIWKPQDLEVDYAKREKMLFTRQCAMVEDSFLIARMGEAISGTTDEFALMPFLNPHEDAAWARLYMVCYIGLNKHLAEPANKQKYDLVMKLMDYISTAEGQDALAADTGAMYSSVIGTQPPDIPEIEHLMGALQSGRYAVFSPLKNAQNALREGLAGMIRGDISREQLIQMVDAQNNNPPSPPPPQKLGQASADFTLIETGSFVTDVMREWSGCDLSLFLDNGKDGRYNGKGLSGRLYQGDVTQTDLLRILPDTKSGETTTVWKVTMSGANLLDTLEYSLSVDNQRTGWFYYFSGLKMEYAPAAEPGSRIKSISLADGSDIKPEQVYSIAVMDYSVPEEYLLSCEKTNQSIESLLAQHIAQSKTISPNRDGRFIVAQP